MRADCSPGGPSGRSVYLGVFGSNWSCALTPEVFAAAINDFDPVTYFGHHLLLRRVTVAVADEFDARSLGCLDSGRL